MAVSINWEDLEFWQNAGPAEFALYFGLLALGALFILGIYFRVRLRCPKPPKDEDDHSHPMT